MAREGCARGFQLFCYPQQPTPLADVAHGPLLYNFFHYKSAEFTYASGTIQKLRPIQSVGAGSACVLQLWGCYIFFIRTLKEISSASTGVNNFIQLAARIQQSIASAEPWIGWFATDYIFGLATQFWQVTNKSMKNCPVKPTSEATQVPNKWLKARG